MLRAWKAALYLVAVLSVLTACTETATAAGYYNMPTSLRQCLGYGYGPGYHAPLCLGPAWTAGTEAQPVIRSRPAACWTPGCTFLAPTPVRPTSECGSGYWDGCVQ